MGSQQIVVPENTLTQTTQGAALSTPGSSFIGNRDSVCSEGFRRPVQLRALECEVRSHTRAHVAFQGPGLFGDPFLPKGSNLGVLPFEQFGDLQV